MGGGVDMKNRTEARRGSALVPTMLIVSGLAVLITAMLSTAISGARTNVAQDEDFRLSSAVESIGNLAVQEIWSDYLAGTGGIPGTITSFQTFLDGLGVEDSGTTEAPKAGEGFDLLPLLAFEVDEEGITHFNGSQLESVNLVRQDEDDFTRLWVTIQTRSERGTALKTRPSQRAAQLAWTVQPDDYAGFNFALLANNVNCIFCHTSVDSVDRWFNSDVNNYSSYDRVRVGTLENLHIRNRNGTGSLTDFDADSTIAGTLYTRGGAHEDDGTSITDWANQSLKSRKFDDLGKLLEDAWGDLETTDFVAAGNPPDACENLYLDYAAEDEEQVDGVLPDSFPPPFPDDGGVDPDTGEPDPSAIGNRIVDDAEFDAIAAAADGFIDSGTMTTVSAGEAIDDINELSTAFFQGTESRIDSGTDGSVMLIGTPNNPIRLNGDVVIDGDVVIAGVVEGEGSIIARGNIYVPGDLEYNDGYDANGNRTFGFGSNGQRNALGLAAGGNVMIGDFQRPSTIQPDGSYKVPANYSYITGNNDTGDPNVDKWSFALSEMALFNRGEWSKTQPLLPRDSAEANGPSSGWTLENPGYVPEYVPRYYGYADGTSIPIQIGGGQYYDAVQGAWVNGPEASISWNDAILEYADPNDPNDPYLFNADGSAKAAVSTISPTDGWFDDFMYKVVVEYLEATRPYGKPLSIDGLVYTNNSIFSIVNRATPMRGRSIVNGALVAADIGLLAPGFYDPNDTLGNQSSQSNYSIGLQLNYDERVKGMLNVVNPSQIGISRSYWAPSIGVQ